MGDINVQRLLLAVVLTLILGVIIGSGLGYIHYILEIRARKARKALEDSNDSNDKETDNESNN
jgi:hypothetical protein